MRIGQLDSEDVLNSALWEVICRTIDKKIGYLASQLEVATEPYMIFRLQGQITALKQIRSKEDFDV